MAPSVGLRNVLIHKYIDVDLAVLAGSIRAAVEGYGEYVRQVARFLGQ